MNFTLNSIKELIDEAMLEQPTGNYFLDTRYQEQVSIIGHTNPYYKLFYLIAQKYRPGLSVELGSWQATAAAHLAIGNPDGQVITIDVHKDDKDAQRRAIEAAQYCANLTYVNAWTCDAGIWVQQTGLPIFDPAILTAPIDLLFIDAWHEYQYIKQEHDRFWPHLADTALVICDDVTESGGTFPGMLRFWDEVTEEKFVDTRPHRGLPMGFIKYERRTMATDRELDTNSQPTDTRPMAPKHRRVSRKA